MNLRAALPLIVMVAIPIMAVTFLLATAGSLPFARDAIAALRAGAGEWWAVPLFFALYVVFALLLLPVGLLAAAAALAWGWKVGGVVELIVATTAALVPYAIARRGLPPRIAAFLARRGVVANLEGEPDFFPLLLLRIVPVVPYVAMNYLAGIARFRTRDFVLTTFLGSIPSVFLFAWFVDTLGAGATGAATQLQIFGACVAVALAAIILRWAARLVQRRVRFAGSTTPPPGVDGPRSAMPPPPPE